MTMTNEAALLAAIQQYPDDDLARTVYADWLEESGGQPDRAAVIRGEVELAHTQDPPTPSDLRRARYVDLPTPPILDIQSYRGFPYIVTTSFRRWLQEGTRLVDGGPAINLVQFSDTPEMSFGTPKRTQNHKPSIRMTEITTRWRVRFPAYEAYDHSATLPQMGPRAQDWRLIRPADDYCGLSCAIDDRALALVQTHDDGLERRVPAYAAYERAVEQARTVDGYLLTKWGFDHMTGIGVKRFAFYPAREEVFGLQVQEELQRRRYTRSGPLILPIGSTS